MPQNYFLSVNLAIHSFRFKYGWRIFPIEDIHFESLEKRGFARISIPYDTKLFFYLCILGHYCVLWTKLQS